MKKLPRSTRLKLKKHSLRVLDADMLWLIAGGDEVEKGNGGHSDSKRPNCGFDGQA